MAATETLEDVEEQTVEEVHCSECNKPMSHIPSWYADVHVRFSCDACRQKSARATPVPPVEPKVAPVQAVRTGEEDETDEETETEDEDTEAETEGLDLADVADTEAEAEPEEQP